jgi:hypothetical protein
MGVTFHQWVTRNLLCLTYHCYRRSFGLTDMALSPFGHLFTTGSDGTAKFFRHNV